MCMRYLQKPELVFGTLPVPSTPVSKPFSVPSHPSPACLVFCFAASLEHKAKVKRKTTPSCSSPTTSECDYKRVPIADPPSIVRTPCLLPLAPMHFLTTQMDATSSSPHPPGRTTDR